MINAKQEFLEFVETKRGAVRCVDISHMSDCKLKDNYTEEEYVKFIESLDFNYNDGYGIQELYGKIWFEGGNWATRAEYDGREWWEYHSTPNIPKDLLY